MEKQKPNIPKGKERQTAGIVEQPGKISSSSLSKEMHSKKTENVSRYTISATEQRTGLQNPDKKMQEMLHYSGYYREHGSNTEPEKLSNQQEAESFWEMKPDTARQAESAEPARVSTNRDRKMEKMLHYSGYYREHNSNTEPEKLSNQQEAESFWEMKPDTARQAESAEPARVSTNPDIKMEKMLHYSGYYREHGSNTELEKEQYKNAAKEKKVEEAEEGSKKVDIAAGLSDPEKNMQELLQYAGFYESRKKNSRRNVSSENQCQKSTPVSDSDTGKGNDKTADFSFQDKEEKSISPKKEAAEEQEIPKYVSEAAFYEGNRQDRKNTAGKKSVSESDMVPTDKKGAMVSESDTVTKKVVEPSRAAAAFRKKKEEEQKKQVQNHSDKAPKQITDQKEINQPDIKGSARNAKEKGASSIHSGGGKGSGKSASGGSTIFVISQAVISFYQQHKEKKQQNQIQKEEAGARRQLMGMTTNTIGTAAKLMSAGVPVLPFLVIILLIFSFMMIFVHQGQNMGTGLSKQYDGACYLAAKYESGGNPDQTGGDGGNACGEFQFDNRYELGPFVSWCYGKDTSFYQEFEPYLGMTTELKSNTGFFNAWHRICAKNRGTFEAAQCEYVYCQKLVPVLEQLTRNYGFDFNNCSDALKGCVLSFANRDGANLASLARYFNGTTSTSTEKDIITQAYDRMIRRRPSIPRWTYEKADCLSMLAGTLSIYEASNNAAGSIDWSWKSVQGGSDAGNQAAQNALNCIGSAYSQAGRDQPGSYDCSSLVYRSYNAAGITYLNGMCAAEEARYLVEHNMTVTRDQLEPGDLIFYARGSNGRYRNISHVAMYVGNGEMVEAANERLGVIKRAIRESNLSPELYCRPQ